MQRDSLSLRMPGGSISLFIPLSCGFFYAYDVHIYIYVVEQMKLCLTVVLCGTRMPIRNPGQ